jgi:hypothetical protein
MNSTLPRRAQARGRTSIRFLLHKIVVVVVVVLVLSVNADEVTGMQGDHCTATNALHGGDEAQVDPCEECVQKEVWETFTSHTDSARHNQEHGQMEAQRAFAAMVDEWKELSVVGDQSATCQASLKESKMQQTFLSKRENRYEQAQSRFVSAERERDNLIESVKILKAQLVAVQDKSLQQEGATIEQMQAFRVEVTAETSTRLKHLHAQNEILTAERQELTNDLKRCKDSLQLTKEDLRRELFRANEKNLGTEKRHSAVRDLLLGMMHLFFIVINCIRGGKKKQLRCAAPALLCCIQVAVMVASQTNWDRLELLGLHIGDRVGLERLLFCVAFVVFIFSELFFFLSDEEKRSRESQISSEAITMESAHKQLVVMNAKILRILQAIEPNVVIEEDGNDEVVVDGNDEVMVDGEGEVMVDGNDEVMVVARHGLMRKVLHMCLFLSAVFVIFEILKSMSEKRGS